MKPCLSTLFDQYDRLWGVFTVKKTQLYTTFWLTGSCPCANIHIQCAMCRHLISICLLHASCFHASIATLSCSCTSSHTKNMFSHTFSLMEMCSSTVWHLVSHYFVWCEGTINVMFNLKTLLGCVYVQLLTYKAAFLKNSLSWPTCLHASSSTKRGGDQSEHSILSCDLSPASLKTSCSNTR